MKKTIIKRDRHRNWNIENSFRITLLDISRIHICRYHIGICSGIAAELQAN